MKQLRFLQGLVHKIDTQEALRALLILLVLALISVIIGQLIGEEQLTIWVNHAGMRGPLLLILWKAGTVVFIPFSGSLIYMVSGGLYDVWDAFFIGIIGNAIGISGAFFVGRYRGTRVVTRIVGKKHIQEVLHLVHHLQDTKKFILTRIVLFPLEDFINYAAGMSRMSFIRFFIISLLITTLGSILPILLGNVLI